MKTQRNKAMCVEIARDVLKQLALKKIKAITGHTVIMHDLQKDMWGHPTEDELKASFQERFQNNGVKCKVCAIGSCLVSMVNLENKCSIDEMQRYYKTLIPRMRNYFGAKNMALMESAFERRVMWGQSNFWSWEEEDEMTPILKAAAQWGRRYKTPTLRLQGIMRNIIRNGGDFKLPKKFAAKAAMAK